jgi:hypothetical protein
MSMISTWSFHPIVDLQAAIQRYIAEHKADPKPFTWTKTSEHILSNPPSLMTSVHYLEDPTEEPLPDLSEPREAVEILQPGTSTHSERRPNDTA